jgi:Cu/Ag efflux pump CusA
MACSQIALSIFIALYSIQVFLSRRLSSLCGVFLFKGATIDISQVLSENSLQKAE